ncbi:hypothetical protein ABT120_25715 [Nonomuraea angiospora]
MLVGRQRRHRHLGHVLRIDDPLPALARRVRRRQHREQAITRIEAELERIKAQRAREAGRELSAKARQKAEAVHVRAECALWDHPTLKRWIRQQKNGRLMIDRAKVKAEERLDGKTCWPPAIPISAPKTPHLATRTFSKRSEASGT